MANPLRYKPAKAMNGHEDFQPGDGTHARFPSQTHWTLIVTAGDSSSPEAKEALEHLCRIYWPPLYAFIRLQGNDRDHAKDLTQGFFFHLLKGNLIKQADRKKGRFRTFLLGCLKNFMADQRRYQVAGRRDVRMELFSIDDAEVEEKLRSLLKVEPPPVVAFDVKWAATVFEQALGQVKKDYAKRNRLNVFEVLKGCLSGELAPDSYPEHAAKLGMSNGTFQTNLSRFKDKRDRAVRDVIADTVAPSEINDEIKYLMAVWAAYLKEKT